jgi:hypothetical protein
MANYYIPHPPDSCTHVNSKSSLTGLDPARLGSETRSAAAIPTETVSNPPQETSVSRTCLIKTDHRFVVLNHLDQTMELSNYVTSITKTWTKSKPEPFHADHTQLPVSDLGTTITAC